MAPALPEPETATPTVIPSMAGRAPGRVPVGIGDVFAAAVPSMIAFVALFGMVLAFVAAQGWVDRRDPRLAVARSADEVVRFR